MIANIFYYTGVTGFILKKKLANKTLVLTYHRILPFNIRYRSFSHQAIMVDPANFDMHLHTIKEYFELTDTSALAYGVDKRKHGSDPQCLITFDDGWRDNYDYAYPILKKHDCSAIIFVPLNYVSTEQTFWQERMGYLIWNICEKNTKESIEIIQKYGIEDIVLKNKDTKHAEIMNYVRSLKTKSYKEIEGMINELLAILSHSDGSAVDMHMTWDQLKELSDNGIEIGSHACSHKILTKLTDDEVVEELNRSKRNIEDNLETEVISIAYPNGDYNGEIGEMANKVGYKCGFGTEYGYIDKDTDIYNLKRININDVVADSKATFLATLIGIF